MCRLEILPETALSWIRSPLGTRPAIFVESSGIWQRPSSFSPTEGAQPIFHAVGARGRGRVRFSVGVGVIVKNGGCGGAEGFCVFFGFVFRPRFHRLQVLLFTPPSFCLGVFLFCSHSSWDWGQRSPASVFLGSWPSTLLIFLRVFFAKTLFFHLKKGQFGACLSVSLSFSLVSFTSLCHSLSLFLVVLSFFFLAFFGLFILPLFLGFCFMKGTTSKYYI